MLQAGGLIPGVAPPERGEVPNDGMRRAGDGCLRAEGGPMTPSVAFGVGAFGVGAFVPPAGPNPDPNDGPMFVGGSTLKGGGRAGSAAPLGANRDDAGGADTPPPNKPAADGAAEAPDGAAPPANGANVLANELPFGTSPPPSNVDDGAAGASEDSEE